jgi:glycerol-3-phosphate dehydrogenase
VSVVCRDDGALAIPGEAVTDPVAHVLALAGAVVRHGGELVTDFRLVAIERSAGGMLLRNDAGGLLTARLLVNCAGLWADSVARLAGDDSFEIYPRKGEFLVFDPPAGGPRLEQILLPVPTKRTKGVLVFPTLDGMLVAGPTAVDVADKDDWSVRSRAVDEILPAARAMYPGLRDLEPIAAYAGLRPAGRGVNYVIERSRACPELVNVAAIRSTGLTASLGIAERVCFLAASAGVALASEQPLLPGPARGSSFAGPWWRRTAEYRGVAA